ncbi:MAG TPA: PQQ-binding-like beta-propeller repeat protein [Pirellulaceae bacterium]
MKHWLPSICIVLFTAAAASAADWPQFRGPHSTGIAVPETVLPADIGPEKHVVWKTELPPGHSSPVIGGDQIFLTAVREKEHLETICLDRGSGRTLWRVEAPHDSLEQIHGIGSYAQPSPAADSERVVTMFGSSGLYCYDHSGKELWKQPMGPFNDEFGAASSPIIDGDRVILAQDHDLGSFVAAYDKRTGKQLWRVDRDDFARGYATPVVWTVDAKKQVVMAGSLRVVGYDFDTGSELWTVRGCSRVVCTTPVIGEGNMLYVASWSAGGEPGDTIRMEPFADFMAQFDENKNGTLEKTEVGNSAALKTRFAQCDRDKDGHITQREYDTFEMLFDKSQNGVIAIKPGCRGDATDSNLVWRYEKFAPFCASPLFYRDNLFVMKDGGILTCLDAATGKPAKSARVAGTGNYYASPVAGDGKIYLLSQKGMLSVITAAKQWQLTHSIDFKEECYATPALVDGHIYLRTAGHLYCFGAKGLAAR